MSKESTPVQTYNLPLGNHTLLTAESTQPQLTKLEYLTLEIWKKLIMSEGYKNLPHSAMDKAVKVAKDMIQECNKECD